MLKKYIKNKNNQHTQKETFCDNGNVPYIDGGISYTCVQNCQNSFICILKIYAFKFIKIIIKILHND